MGSTVLHCVTRRLYPAILDNAEVRGTALPSIAAFVRVAENGGFLGAARGLNVATTTVSDQVRALEDALGVRPRLGYCTAVVMLP